MANGIRRDAQGHKSYWQQLKVSSVKGGPVYIGFGQNSFRKHFILPSSSGTSGEVKAGKVGTKRASHYENDWYGGFTNKNTIVDIGQSQLSTVLAVMALELLNAPFNGFDNYTEEEVTFDFGKPIVRQVNTVKSHGAWSVQSSGTQNTISFKCTNPHYRSFVLTHCTNK